MSCTHVVGILYVNICAECGLEVPESRWDTTTDSVWEQQSEDPGGLQVSRLTSSCWPTKQTRWWLTCKVVTDVTIPADSKLRKKMHEEIEKYREMEKQREQMWKVKSKVIDNRNSTVCLTNWKSSSYTLWAQKLALCYSYNPGYRLEVCAI